MEEILERIESHRGELKLLKLKTFEHVLSNLGLTFILD